MKPVTIFKTGNYADTSKRIIQPTKLIYIPCIFFDDIFSVDFNEYGSKTLKGKRFTLVAFDSFRKVGSRVLLRNKSEQMTEISFVKILKTSEWKQNSFETEYGRELVNKF